MSVLVEGALAPLLLSHGHGTPLEPAVWTVHRNGQTTPGPHRSST